MKKVIFFFFLGLTLCSFSQVQSFLRTYGIDGFNYGNKLAVLSDTTYLLLGNKTGFGSMNNVYLIHTDDNGNIIKDGVFGGNDLFYATDMFVAGDTLFIITGYTLDNLNHAYNVFFMLINRDLDPVLIQTFPSAAWDHGKAVVSDQSGDIFLAVESYSHGPKAAIRMIRTDQNGIQNGELIISDAFHEYYPEAMIITDDTMLYVCGSVQQHGMYTRGFIFRISADFQNVDTLFFEEAGKNIFYTDIVRAASDRISVVGYFTEDQDVSKKLLYHSCNTDLQITGVIWDNVPGGHCNSIATSVDGKTVLGCYTSVYGAGNGDFMFLVFDFNAYIFATTAGGIMYDELFDIACALDSSLVMIGTTQSFGTPVTSIMFAKTCKDFYFCVNDNLHIANIENPGQDDNVVLFPQPATDVLNLRIPGLSELPDYFIHIFSVTGQKIACQYIDTGQNTVRINVSGLVPGAYFLSFESESLTFCRKIIIF